MKDDFDQDKAEGRRNNRRISSSSRQKLMNKGSGGRMAPEEITASNRQEKIRTLSKDPVRERKESSGRNVKKRISEGINDQRG